MRIRKIEQSVGVVGKILNSISNSLINTYSANFINQLILDRSHPVNSIYITVSPENPSSILGGGEWIRFAEGKTLVGVDESDSDFNIVEKTGGSKDLQAHTHKLSKHVVVGNYLGGWNLISENNGFWSSDNSTISTTTAGTGNAGNLQPYITVYFWKRVA